MRLVIVTWLGPIMLPQQRFLRREVAQPVSGFGFAASTDASPKISRVRGNNVLGNGYVMGNGYVVM